MASISPTLYSPGVGSGLDVKSLVAQLVAVERIPLQGMQAAAAGLNTKLSVVGQIKSYLSVFRDAAAALANADTWKAASATSSNSAIVSATTSAGAATGTYTVAVGTLAASQSNATTAVAASTTTIGQGSLTIDLGAWNSTDTAFTVKSGSSPIVINIGPGQDTLAGIRDQINAANQGVSASIVTDGSGARLV